MSRALILMYHAVDEPGCAAESRYCVTPASFRAQMDHLVNSGRTPITLDALVHAFKTGKALPVNSVAVTFDDGFECFRRNALPVLSEFHIPATLFAVAGKLGETNTWMRDHACPERRLMSKQELREIRSAGVTVGCHALSHKPMTQLNDDELIAETAVAGRILRDALGTDVTLFAYPHGDQSERERRAVAGAGFVAACGTAPGFNRHGVDLYDLRRIDIYGNDSLANFRRKLEFGANQVTFGGCARYYINRLLAHLHT